jgi:hypothetical protein
MTFNAFPDSGVHDGFPKHAIIKTPTGIRGKLRHPPAAQTPQQQLRALPGRAAQRTLATRHHPLGTGRRADVEILNILDDHSRLCVGSKTLLVFKVGDVKNSFGKAVAANGNPASLLSGNGAV